MKMRRGFGWAWALVTVVIAGVAAWFAYHAGLATTIGASGRDGVYYGGYPGYGFGFGFIWLLLFILLIALVFRRRRWHGYWGGRGWGGYGHGYGPPSDKPDVPPVIEERLRAWHDRAHGENPAEAGGGQQAPGQPGGPPAEGS
jgi:hypothetical protein